MLLSTKRSEKVKRNLRKYRKTKFNYEHFVSEYYVDDDGKAYISTKVSSIYDIISKHSIKDYEWVNPDFIHYVEDMAYYIPVEESIVLEICGHHFSEKECVTVGAATMLFPVRAHGQGAKCCQCSA